MSMAPYLAPERDPAFQIGRPKTGSTTYFMYPTPGASSYTNWGPTAGVDYYEPMRLTDPWLVDQLAFYVGTLGSGSNTRIGLYPADGDWQPIGGPLLDSGDISTATTGIKTYTPGSPLFLPRGRYLVALNCSATAPSLRVHTGHAGVPLVSQDGDPNTSITFYSVARTHAAFPTPGTAWTTPASYSGAGYYSPVSFRRVA